LRIQQDFAAACVLSAGWRCHPGWNTKLKKELIMSEISNSAAGLSIFGSNPLSVGNRKSQVRAPRSVSAGRVQSPSIVLARSIHQPGHGEDRAWAILALAALALVAMCAWL
jgi:hypothetical protein